MFESQLARARKGTLAPIAVALLRIFLGFAFLPAGLKKVLGEPFTDAALDGPFHDFLHAFHATGWFYAFVGGVQLVAAVLLMTSRFAFAGAVLMFPVLTAIGAFCWSTRVVPTATVVTLMWFGALALLLWDWGLWRGVFERRPPDPALHRALRHEALHRALWGQAGALAIGLYLGACALESGVYRPRGAEWTTPAFYAFPLMLAVVGAAAAVEVRKRRFVTERDAARAPANDALPEN